MNESHKLLQHNVYFLREKRRGFRQSVEGYYENQLKMQSSHENLAPQVIQGLIKELRQLSRKPPVGVKYVPNDDDTIGTVHSELEGPVGTPFEGGVFHIKQDWILNGHPGGHQPILENCGKVLAVRRL